MVTLAQGRAIACGFAFVLSAFAAQSIFANETPVTAATNQSDINTAASAAQEQAPQEQARQDQLPYEPVRPDQIEAQAQPQSPELPRKRPVVVALAEPNPPVARKSPARELPPAPNSAWQTAARFFTINEVLAKHRTASTPPAVRLASADPSGQISDAEQLAIPAARGEEPFGLFTFKAPNGLLWTKWHKVESEIQAEAPMLARCRADASQCTPGAARFATIIKQAGSRQGRARLELVNQKINDAVHYTSDFTQWGVADRWSAPVDANHEGSLDTGLGDCEDYAIAKYVALRETGVPAAQLRVLLVHDNMARMDHAVLAANDGGHWFILDNRWMITVEDIEVRQFRPLFALDEQGVKLLAAPYASNQPAGLKTADSAGQIFVPGGDAADPAPAAAVDAKTGAMTGIGAAPLLL